MAMVQHLMQFEATRIFKAIRGGTQNSNCLHDLHSQAWFDVMIFESVFVENFQARFVVVWLFSDNRSDQNLYQIWSCLWKTSTAKCHCILFTSELHPDCLANMIDFSMISVMLQETGSPFSQRSEV